MINHDDFAQAVRHHDSGDLAAAEETLRRVLTNDPHHFGALHRLGIIALQRQNNAEAASLLSTALAQNPQSAAAHFNLGTAFNALGQPAEAAAAFEHAAYLQPGNADFHFTLAANLASLGRPLEAIERYERGLTLSADRPRIWNNLGVVHAEMGRLREAEACFREALTRRPEYLEALVNRVNALADLNQVSEAAACCEQGLAHFPANPQLKFLRAALTGRDAPSTMPRDMVLALFESYAPIFDEHLVNGVSYQGPRMLREAVDRCRPADKFDILDLGCGTGLCGTAFRDRARRLVGVDLSPKMLAHARRRQIYDELIEGDIVDVMNAWPESYDLILAADLFVYIGALDAVIPACARALRPGGLLAVVVESDDGEGFQLQRTRRFAHSGSYLRRLTQAFGFSELTNARSFLRQQAGGDCLGDAFLFSFLG